MVKAAMEKGLTRIGFVAHSYTFFDESYCIKKERIPEYKKEIAYLRHRYAGKIDILCGIEQDLYSTESTVGYDFVIGSVHYIKKNGVYLDTDDTKEKLCGIVENTYGGDWYALCEDYYREMAKLSVFDFVGHFDLITKFNEGNALFDEEHPRYKTAVLTALDAIAKPGTVFEINTGAVSRGYRSRPYPSPFILGELKKRQCGLILSSDAHTEEGVAFGFDRYESLLG